MDHLGSRIVRKLEDGTLVRADGKIASFGMGQFLERIVLGNGCYVCGEGEEELTKEHVIPQWVQRRCNLSAEQITLPNGGTRQYGKKTLPCCRSCNAVLGDRLEKPVAAAISTSGELLDRSPEALWRIFVWMAALFIKVHLRDTMYREVLRHDLPDQGNIAARYDWSELHHIYCLARAPVANVIPAPEVLGSTLFLPMEPAGPEAFDYVDLCPGMVVMVRMGDLGIVSALDDSCMVMHVLQPFLERIRAPLSGVQLRELTARMAYANQNLREKPTYFTECLPFSSHVRMGARLPGTLEFVGDHGPNEAYGEKLHYVLADVVKELQPGLAAQEVDQRLRSGAWTFFTDAA